MKVVKGKDIGVLSWNSCIERRLIRKVLTLAYLLEVGKLNYIASIDSCLSIFLICHICYYIVSQGNEALSRIALLDDLQKSFYTN